MGQKGTAEHNAALLSVQEHAMLVASSRNGAAKGSLARRHEEEVKDYKFTAEPYAVPRRLTA